MVTLKNVLVPTDFSETSERAFAYARTLAESFDAKMHVLHVIPDPYSQPWSIEATGIAIPELLKTWEGDARKRLEEMKPDDIETELITQVGHPFVQIIRYAKEHEIDLIVLGTHGRGPIGHMFLGSVAEKVVRKAPCPVLTVRHPEHTFESP